MPATSRTQKTPAKITKAAKAESTKVGDSVTLKCEVSGNPIPTGSWSKNNKKLGQGGRFSTKSTPDFVHLVISSLEEGDTGEYKCTVSNGVGEDSCTVKLTVEGGGASAGDDDEEDDKDLDLPKRDPVVLQKDKKYEDLYESGDELGKGKFGVVRKCKEKKTGTVFAAKFIRTTNESRKEVVQEMEMMNLLSSKRLIYLQDAFERPKEMIIILEFIAGGELFEKVCAEDNLSEKDVVRYMRQILQGVQHMHKRNMVHLDLKPENVLCVVRPDGKEDLKLIDFGMAKILKAGKKVTAGCGTPEFVAPEALAMDPITLASDMWSVGVIAYVLLSGLSPFMGDDDSETMNNVAQCEWDFEDESFDVVSDVSKKFIEELLILNPKKRMTVDQCLNHEWFSRKTKISGEKLSTDKLKQFMARRRWIKTANALRALSRMGNLSGLLGGTKPSTKKPDDKPSPQLSGKRGPTITAR